MSTQLNTSAFGTTRKGSRAGTSAGSVLLAAISAVSAITVEDKIVYDDFTKGKRTKGSEERGLLRAAGIYETDQVFSKTESGWRELEFATRPETQIQLYNQHPELATQEIAIVRQLNEGTARTKVMHLPVGYFDQLKQVSDAAAA